MTSAAFTGCRSTASYLVVSPFGLWLCRPHEATSGQQDVLPSQLPTLLDVVQEAPALLECLSPKARTALSGCNRQLRAHFRSTTKIITLSKKSHAAALTNRDWPMLTAIILRGVPEGFHDWGGDQVVHAVTLKLSDSGRTTCVAILFTSHKRIFPIPSQLLSTAFCTCTSPSMQQLVSSSYILVPALIYTT